MFCIWIALIPGLLTEAPSFMVGRYLTNPLKPNLPSTSGNGSNSSIGARQPNRPAGPPLLQVAAYFCYGGDRVYSSME